MREEANIPESAQAGRDRFSNGARVAVEKKDLAAAKSKAESIRELAEAAGNPNQVKLYHELAGMIALARKDYDQAIEELQQANQLNPYNLYRLAVAYGAQGDKEQAKRLCEQIATLNQLNSINYGLARRKAQSMLASLSGRRRSDTAPAFGAASRDSRWAGIGLHSSFLGAQ